jgi:hypothetical protein
MDLLLLQTLAEFEKIKEVEKEKELREKALDNLNMAYYHKGKHDGLELLIDRVKFIKDLKNER